MDSMARFLGIEENETLLTPTVNGIPATSNSMFSKRRTVGRVVATDTIPSGRGLTEADETVARILTRRPAAKYGYQLPAPSIAGYLTLYTELGALLRRKLARLM
jgi:hypothetical protein